MGNPQADRTCDLLVIGSGGAGFTSAITAATLGLDVIVIEKADVLGGATAQAGGMIWIPGHGLDGGPDAQHHVDQARIYLRNEMGRRYDDRIVEAYLSTGPDMVRFLRDQGAARFEPVTNWPDYHPDQTGASKVGQGIFPSNSDARLLGDLLGQIRPGNPFLKAFGVPLSRIDIPRFQTAGRKFSSFRYAAWHIVRAALDVVRYGQSMRLVAGRSLIAQLVKSAYDHGVTIMRSTALRSLMCDAGRVAGAIVVADGREMTIAARKGVVLATGGFPFDAENRAKYYPGGRQDVVWGALPPTATGDGLRCGAAVSGKIVEDLDSPIAFAPVTPTIKEGEWRTFPIFPTRSLPGYVAVLPNGRRFTNEAASYHDFGKALYEASPDKGDPYCYIVCDHAALLRYGMGPVAPFPIPYHHYLPSGVLKRGRTIRALAEMCCIDGPALEDTIAHFNQAAMEGVDREFHRGENVLNRVTGDPTHSPNPNMGPLIKAPFFAMKAYAGAIATFVGLSVDEHARVRSADGKTIDGLYAIGNDAMNVFGGNYVAGGSTIGPGMTFGYIAARHAASTQSRH